MLLFLLILGIFSLAGINRRGRFAIALALTCAVSSREIPAAEKGAAFEGRVTATLTRSGAATTQFLFTRKENELRIENSGSKLEPINIVDLDAKKLTIIFPHNSTFLHVDLIRQLPDRAQPGAPPLNPNSGGEAAGFRGTTTSSPTAPKMSPPPGFPTPLPIASMPPIPPMPSSGSGAAGMPMMPPPMPGMFGAAELKKTEKTKKIQGFDCTLYTMSDRGENFEIWATNDAALFPFRLLQRDYNVRRFGPQMIEEQWVELLQRKSLFPLEATLRSEPGGQERLSFKVSHIDRKKIDPGDLFSVPKDLYEILPPQF